MKLDQIDAWINDIVSREVDQWFKRQCRDPYSAFYLYYTQGDVRIDTHSPGPEWNLARAERISTAWTKDRAHYFAINALYSCPCLPIEQAAPAGTETATANR